MKKRVLTNDEMSLLCRSLGMMLSAGAEAADALYIMAEDEEGELKELLSEMATRADEGSSLSCVLGETEVFPGYVSGLIAAGEESGRTAEALNALADRCEAQAAAGRRLRSALLYPSLLVVIMLAVIVILLVYVLPVFSEVYARLGVNLSGAAAVLLYLGQVLGRFMPLVCAVPVCAAVAAVFFSVSSSFRKRLAAAFRSKYGDRGVFGQLNAARFAGAMAMCLAGGCGAEGAVRLAAAALDGIPAAQARCRDCLERLAAGETPPAALGAAGLLPAAECRLLGAAAKAGCADTAMAQIAVRLAGAAESAIEEKLARVEPCIVIVCSALAGFILLSAMMPLMHIMAAIGQ